jgi:plasmid replication initiation protein
MNYFFLINIMLFRTTTNIFLCCCLECLIKDLCLKCLGRLSKLVISVLSKLNYSFFLVNYSFFLVNYIANYSFFLVNYSFFLVNYSLSIVLRIVACYHISIEGENMDKNYIVTKSNKLISCNYDLNLQEQRIILTLASMVQPHDIEFKDYEFRIKDFIELLGVKDEKKYIEVPKITKELMKKVFEIREGKKIIQLSWLSSAVYETGAGKVILSFDKNLKPYMLGLKELYTSYRLENVLSLRSKYSIRLYEILKSNSFKKCIEVELKELREMVGANEKTYNIYGNLKSKILLHSQKELKGLTDISFEFEEIKTGRKVTSIKFIIYSKDKAKHEIAAIKENTVNKIRATEKPSNDLIKQVQAICHKHKITEYEASSILKDACNNLELIKQRYEYMLTQKKVDNVIGYMRHIVVTFDKSKINMKIDDFNNFEQRTYDYDNLEEHLLGWSKK